MLNRERWTELSKLELQLTAQGIFAGGKSEAVIQGVKSMASEYRSRLFHHGFSARRLAVALRKELNEIRKAQSQLKKLSAMTV